MDPWTMLGEGPHTFFLDRQHGLCVRTRDGRERPLNDDERLAIIRDRPDILYQASTQ